MRNVSREERRQRVRNSVKHREKIAEMLKDHGYQKAHKIYLNMSMHSCHFTHIAMAIWTNAQELSIPDSTLAKAWQSILIEYAQVKYSSADDAGQQLLRGLLVHGGEVLSVSLTNLIEQLHPFDQNKVKQVEYGG